MSVSFAVGANDVRWTAGSAGAVGTGAFSLYALVQPGVGNNNAGFIAAYATNTLTRGVGESSLHLYGPNDFSPSGFGTLTQGNWYEVMVTKSSASAPWRMHYRDVNPGGSPGTWSHGVATSGSNQGNGSTTTNFRIGNVGIAQANGLIAAWAAWTSELADATIDLIDGTGLASVNAQSPIELVALDQWTGTSGDTVLVGTCSRSAITGTASVGANPTGFGFTLGGSPVTASDTPSGIRWGSGADVGVTTVVVVPDAPSRVAWRSGTETTAVSSVVADGAAGLRWRSSDGAGVAVGIQVQDTPGGWGWNAAAEAGITTALVIADGGAGFRWRTAPDHGVVFDLVLVDTPAGYRWGSAADAGVSLGTAVSDTSSSGWRLRAGADGVTYGVAIPDQASGWGLGPPSATIAVSGVVSDTPGGWRWLSGASDVTIGAPPGPIAVDDAATGWRWRAGVSPGVVIYGPPALGVSIRSLVWADRFDSAIGISTLGSTVTIDRLP